MELSLDRQRQWGRHCPDICDVLTAHGLLHDLGHGIATLAHLVEAVRGDPTLSESSATRMELITREMSRLLDVVAGEIAGHVEDVVEAVDVRALGSQVAELAAGRSGASVVLLPGPDVTLCANPNLLWRVLFNVVDNAARAAGPKGRVEIAISGAEAVVIDVTDDGPGFGRGQAGQASIGLPVVGSLIGSCGKT